MELPAILDLIAEAERLRAESRQLRAELRALAEGARKRCYKIKAYNNMRWGAVVPAAKRGMKLNRPPRKSGG